LVLAELDNSSIGWLIAFVATAAVVVYAAVNVLSHGKPELGAEIELAANRKPYLSDEELEGPKLDKTLSIALLVLFVIAIGLPLYWIFEPGRQANAKVDFDKVFVTRGSKLFAPTADGGFNCAFCHGGMDAKGNVVDYNLTEPDGTTTAVKWRAPALNTVLLRYSRKEVTYILTYGRPQTPMPAWGLDGGGPLNAQQIQNLVDYLESIQLTPEESQQQARDELKRMMGEKDASGAPLWKSEGEALFNMGLTGTQAFAGGAYGCGRCHTQGWSYYEADPDGNQQYDLSKLPGQGCGALGPSLCNGSVTRQFPAVPEEQPCVEPSSDSSATTTTTKPQPPTGGPTTTAVPECVNPVQNHIDFVTNGSEDGIKYGIHGQGTGKMPGFGQRPGEPALFWINKGKEREPSAGMLPIDLIEKIVDYERSL
jgi:mono/diheme cytochrome c family protein